VEELKDPEKPAKFKKRRARERLLSERQAVVLATASFESGVGEIVARQDDG
jgi:hypothetical protein